MVVAGCDEEEEEAATSADAPMVVLPAAGAFSSGCMSFMLRFDVWKGDLLRERRAAGTFLELDGVAQRWRERCFVAVSSCPSLKVTAAMAGARNTVLAVATTCLLV